MHGKNLRVTYVILKKNLLVSGASYPTKSMKFLAWFALSNVVILLAAAPSSTLSETCRKRISPLRRRISLRLVGFLYYLHGASETSGESARLVCPGYHCPA